MAYDQLIRWLASHDATPINADLADADLHHFITFCRDNRLHKHAVTASRALRDRMHARSDSPIEALRDLNRLYAGCLRGAEMYDEAEATLRESIAESDGATPSQDDWDRIGLARVATAREETEAAQDLLREVIDRCDASGRALTPVAERAMNELSDLVDAENEPDEYDRLNARAWEAWNAQVGAASNLDFESGYPGGPAAAWPRVDSWTQVANWHVVSDQQPFEGRYCGKLITLAGRPLDTEPRWFRSMGQYLDATKYRGKRIRYSAADPRRRRRALRRCPALVSCRPPRRCPAPPVREHARQTNQVWRVGPVPARGTRRRRRGTPLHRRDRRRLRDGLCRRRSA